MIWALLGLSEASLGPLRSVSWAAQKAPETLENVMFGLPDRFGRAAALPAPRRWSRGPKIIPVLRCWQPKYYAPPANLTQGGANLAQLSMTARFYTQDAVTAANLTHVGLTWHKHARHCSDSKKEKGSQAGGARSW